MGGLGEVLVVPSYLTLPRDSILEGAIYLISARKQVSAQNFAFRING